MKLILFDIDGTLLDSGGAGSRAIKASLGEVLDIPGKTFKNSSTPMAGKTDPQILREMLNKMGISHDKALIDSILVNYLKHLNIEIRGNRKSLKPSVIELLDWLSKANNARLGLLTGNIEEGARIKLRSFGIWERFGFGAYGSDHEDRNELLPWALKRFKRLTGNEVTFGDCIVIGDTPRDIECSKPYGAFALAVATGPFNARSLQAAGADAVIADLSKAREVLAPLLSAD